MNYIKTRLRQLRWSWSNLRYILLRRNHSNGEVFSDIYRSNTWGSHGNHAFYSGSGSHNDAVVKEYVGALEKYIRETFGVDKPSVIDIGCGDFNVGSRTTHLFKKYIAVDVVEELIEYNKGRWQQPGIEFQTMDVTSEPIPSVDVAVVREVFQHLSNRDITRAIENIIGRCSILVVTDIRPGALDFPANLDKPTGKGSRSQFGSGVDLQEPPFSLKFSECRDILTKTTGERLLVTTAYRLQRSNESLGSIAMLN